MSSLAFMDQLTVNGACFEVEQVVAAPVGKLCVTPYST